MTIDLLFDCMHASSNFGPANCAIALPMKCFVEVCNSLGGGCSGRGFVGLNSAFLASRSDGWCALLGAFGSGIGLGDASYLFA